MIVMMLNDDILQLIGRVKGRAPLVGCLTGAIERHTLCQAEHLLGMRITWGQEMKQPRRTSSRVDLPALG